MPERITPPTKSVPKGDGAKNGGNETLTTPKVDSDNTSIWSGKEAKNKIF